MQPKKLQNVYEKSGHQIQKFAAEDFVSLLYLEAIMCKNFYSKTLEL